MPSVNNSNKESYLKSIRYKQVQISLRTDGIVHVEFLETTEIDLVFQKQLIEIYSKMTNGEKSYFIFEGGELITLTKEAKEHTNLFTNNDFPVVSAIIVNNIGQKMLIDFYYKIHKPKLPFKIFYSFEKGIEWLNSVKN